MELIKLTIATRNTIPIGTEYAVDVDSITSPIRYNDEGVVSYFTLRTKLPTGLPGGFIDYMVSEDLETIAAMSNSFVRLTVTSRDGRPITVGGVTVASEQMIFNIKKLSEGFTPSGSGAAFLYCEDGEPTPVPYIVSEDIDGIMSQISGESGSGTVTSVSADDSGVSDVFTTNVTNATSTPEIAFSLVPVPANTFLAGGSGGGDNEVPTFRNIVGSDLPISVSEDTGGFVDLSDDQALTITINGTTYYIPIYIYTP